MRKQKPFSGKLKDKVLMIGYGPDGKNVYSAFLSVHDYYDGDHPWDSAALVKEMTLRAVHGYIFGESGQLEKEFESHFDLETGIYESGWSRDENGVVTPE